MATIYFEDQQLIYYPKANQKLPHKRGEGTTYNTKQPPLGRTIPCTLILLSNHTKYKYNQDTNT